MVHVWVRAYVLWLVGIGAVLKQQFHHGSVPLQESEHEWLPPRATRKIVASGSEVNLSVSPSAGTGRVEGVFPVRFRPTQGGVVYYFSC